jgi:hypothetical protein
MKGLSAKGLPSHLFNCHDDSLLQLATSNLKTHGRKRYLLVNPPIYFSEKKGYGGPRDMISRLLMNLLENSSPIDHSIVSLKSNPWGWFSEELEEV